MLVLRNDVDGLQKLSQHNVTNAFANVDFGVPGLGIINATPLDMLHTFRQGLVVYSLGICLDLLGRNKRAELDGLCWRNFIHVIIFGVYEEKYFRCLKGSGKTIPTDTTGLRG